MRIRPQFMGNAVKLSRSLSGVEAIVLALAPLSQRQIGFAIA